MRDCDGFSDHEEFVVRLLEQLDDKPMREALSEVFAGDSADEDLLYDLFMPGTEDWRVLVSDHIQGTCLDLYADYGKRSLLLAELADRVYAVDPDPVRLRFLARRDDYESTSDVVPVQATVNSLPFPDGAFDTIVTTEAVFDRTEPSPSLDSTVVSLRERLADRGTLILLLDGWVRLLGLVDALGIESGSSKREVASATGLRRLLRSNSRGYQSLLEANGFKTVNTYALWPTRKLPGAIFNTDSQSAIKRVVGSPSPGARGAERAAHLLADTFSKWNILSYFYPSYLIVCTNENPTTTDGWEQLLLSGRSRSVVMDLCDGDLRRVTKVPSRQQHASFIEREASILQRLHETDAQVTNTLPTGTLTQSRFGSVYVEQPVSGTVLTESMETSVEGFRATLEVGLRWLRQFQQTYRGDDIVLSPEDVQCDLSFERFGLTSPSVSEPVRMFETPCHGDFTPKNIYVHDDGVSEVLDWEYSSLSGYPVTDLAYYVLRSAMSTFGGLKAGIETAFVDETPYSSVLRSLITEYCDELGIPVRAFIRYLPYPWIRHLKINFATDAWNSYLLPAGVMPDIQFLWDQMEAIERRILR